MLIKLDLAPLKGALLNAFPNPADLNRFIGGLAGAARQRIVGMAQASLKTSARDYIAGISEIEQNGRVARITLTGVTPNMVENGWPATDLRLTLLGPGAKNVKIGKDGSRYNTVPFRHGTPGSSGRNVGQPMPTSIHAAAKKLSPTLSRAGGIEGKGGQITAYGQRLNPSLPMSAQARKILGTKKQPWHSASIYMGMIRQEKTYKNATQSQFTTFRRISTNSRADEKHWLHPGIQARRFFTKAQQEVDTIVGQTLASALATRRGSK